MKPIRIVCATMIVLFFVTCKKKECCDIPVAPDFMLAQKNGVKWEADPSGSNLLGDTITISAKSNTGGEEETMNFKIVFDGLGYYSLRANENYYGISKAGAPSAVYKPDPTHVNNVTIIAYNQSGRILQGFFDLRFVKISDNANNLHPDKIIMSEGKFKATLNQ
ncbi:hypothetical protein [Mucilaginibacter celer]|uniref:Uncharacterized protein n=1 Tax=Mucilaginibacter celer TaxID=2305508 RepID=A0A494VZ27_9SPHI|nr:hypothetical protein [Mucilaginibacter celer]AYL98740.1 hypothetical protein HYN43_027235 [Mucilaginibacter celer]